MPIIQCERCLSHQRAEEAKRIEDLDKQIEKATPKVAKEKMISIQNIESTSVSNASSVSTTNKFKFCEECGKKLKMKANFCNKCGTKQIDEDDQDIFNLPIINLELVKQNAQRNPELY